MSKLRAAAVFSNHMVLQRNKLIPIWGEAQEGRMISVRCFQHTSWTRVRNGRWIVWLPKQPAGIRDDILISDGETQLVLTDVVCGDVWFAGGQSNMELELQNCKDGVAELTACEDADIRFYLVPRTAREDEELERLENAASWQLCSPSTAAQLSAVAYFCARKLRHELDVPIGIICCYWGGTSVSAWMSEAQLLRTSAGTRCIEEYDALIDGKSEAEYEREMQEYHAAWTAWNARVEARRALQPDVSWEVLNAECGLCPWPQPAGRLSPFRPTNLYHSMVRRIVPYALKGFLYYQGEEDEKRCYDYGELLCYLIAQWRGDWGDESLPFLFVQLPMYASREEAAMGYPSENWPVLREQQDWVSRFVANTGMAVVIDCGEFDNIHPLDKQTVGYRLALQALQKAYGKQVQATAPRAVHAQRRTDGTINICFEDTGGGLEAKGALDGFTLINAEGQRWSAAAAIEGDGINLQCSNADALRAAVYAGYAWISYGPTPLYGKNGLPAAPFKLAIDETIG